MYVDLCLSRNRIGMPRTHLALAGTPVDWHHYYVCLALIPIYIGVTVDMFQQRVHPSGTLIGVTLEMCHNVVKVLQNHTEAESAWGLTHSQLQSDFAVLWQALQWVYSSTAHIAPIQDFGRTAFSDFWTVRHYKWFSSARPCPAVFIGYTPRTQSLNAKQHTVICCDTTVLWTLCLTIHISVIASTNLHSHRGRVRSVSAPMSYHWCAFEHACMRQLALSMITSENFSVHTRQCGGRNPARRDYKCSFKYSGLAMLLH